MKLKKRVFLCTFLALVMLFVSCFAQSAGPVGTLVDAGASLLFDTDNVTLEGFADFSLNGERFKTAQITYKQAGEDSIWDLRLFTPRQFRSDRETGYTVIANGGDIYVMERYTPGVYRDGTDTPNNTLVRRSTRSDLLVSMGRALAGTVEALLPADDVYITAVETGGREIVVNLTKDTVPDIINPFLNVCVDFILNRFMGVDYDRLNGTDRAGWDEYYTITRDILYTTSSFSIDTCSFVAAVDEKGALTQLQGLVDVLLSSKTESDAVLRVSFDLNAYDYGATSVDVFDPLAYNVVPEGAETQQETVVPADLADRLVARSKEVLYTAGFTADDFGVPEISEDDELYMITYPGYGDFDVITVTLNEDGLLLALADGRWQWYMAPAQEPSETELPTEAVDLLCSFLQEACPEIAAQCVSFIPRLEYNYEDAVCVYIIPQDAEGRDLPYSFYLRLTGPMRLVSYTCLYE